MKKSKIIDLEEDIYESDSDSDIEISKTKNIKKDVPIEEPKTKPKKTDKQIEAWNKALKIREENREKRKKEKEENQRLEKEKLESKILLKAKRIKKAQSKVLGDDVDEIEMIERPKRIKKKVIIYKSESESSEEEIIVKKNKPKKKQIEQVIEKHLPDNKYNHVISNPTYRRVINFV